MRKRRRLLPGLLMSVFCLIQTDCGLEQIVNLDPPERVILSGVDKYQFKADEDNDELEFRGFELYYKFYLAGATIDINLDSLEELQSYGYKRIHSEDDRVGSVSKPLVHIDSLDRGKSYTITIDFEGTLVPPQPRIYDDGELSESVDVQDIRRGVTYTETGLSDEYKQFTDFEETDGDIDSALWNAINSSQEVVLVLYVLSYGRSEEQSVYSIPVWLGDNCQRVF